MLALTTSTLTYPVTVPEPSEPGAEFGSSFDDGP